MLRNIHVLLLALVVALAGCAEKTPPADPPASGGSTDDGDDTETPPTATPVRAATFMAADYTFTGPANVSAGWVTFTLENTGSEPHELYISSLGGQTFEEFQDLLQEDMASMGDENATEEGPMDENATEEGPPEPGIGGIHPGMERSATVKLAPGGYVLACWIPSPDGVPHAFKGMVAELTVTAAAENPTPTGEDTTITIADGNVTIAPAFTAGAHTVKVVNSGTDASEDFLGLQFVQLDGNATPADFIAAFGPDASGPPPGKAWGGLTGVAGGKSAWFTVDLPAGRYAILSFDHEPRSVAEFTVA